MSPNPVRAAAAKAKAKAKAQAKAKAEAQAEAQAKAKAKAEAKAEAEPEAAGRPQLTELQRAVSRAYGGRSRASSPPPARALGFRAQCFPRGGAFRVQPQQRFVAEYLGPRPPGGAGGGGLLLFHRIGAGKTCAAIRAAEAWAGLRGRRREGRIVVVAPASLVGNFRRELAGPCGGGGAHAERYDVMSINRFVRLVEEGRGPLRRAAMLVVDEVQNVVSETGAWYAAFRRALAAAPPRMRTVLMSATPIFDRPSEIALTLNLLRPATPLPTGDAFDATFLRETAAGGDYRMTNGALFRRLVGGLVSFFPGAAASAFPRERQRVVRCRMSPYQYASYRAVERREGGAGFRDMLRTPNDFLIGSRQAANVAFPGRRAVSDVRPADLARWAEGGGSEGAALLGDAGLARHACKVAALVAALERGRRRRGRGAGGGPTAFVFSSFSGPGGLATLRAALLRRGWRDFAEAGPGPDRFATWTGDDRPEAREGALAAFNDPANADGSRLRVLMGSPAAKEGLNLLRCRQVHLLDPQWNASRVAQAVGRAVRLCSHRDLPRAAREVAVYHYLAVAPGGRARSRAPPTVDERIRAMARAKARLNAAFERALREAAVDRALFQGPPRSRAARAA